MPSSKLFDMLSDLAKDPKLMTEFKKDPAALMRKYRLTKKQVDMIRSAMKGNQHDMLKVMGDEMHKHFAASGKPQPHIFC